MFNQLLQTAEADEWLPVDTPETIGPPPSQRRARRAGMTPRALEARRDLLRVHDLLLMGKRQCDIAAEMGKDAGWVSRTVRRIQQDPALVYSAPNAQTIVAEQLANLDALMRLALEHAGQSDGATKTGALRLVADLQEKRTAFLERVGILRPLLSTGQPEMSEGDAFLAAMRQDLPLHSVMIIREEARAISNERENPLLRLCRDNDGGALPFHLRESPGRFARARQVSTTERV